MIRRVLVVLGGSPLYPAAIRRAAELARAFGGRVTALRWVDAEVWRGRISSSDSAGEAARELEDRPWLGSEQHLERMIEACRSACEEAGVEMAVESGGSAPWERLADLWRYHDVVVFGLRGLFDYGLVSDPGETAAEIVRRGVRPILAVSGDWRPVRRVLICYSGSMESAKSMKQYVQMGLWRGAVVRIVTHGEDERSGRMLLKDAADYCEAHGVRVETAWERGSAAEGLLSAAERMDADLVVMGDSFRSTWVDRAMGRTALEMIRRCDRTLFLSH